MRAIYCSSQNCTLNFYRFISTRSHWKSIGFELVPCTQKGERQRSNYSVEYRRLTLERSFVSSSTLSTHCCGYFSQFFVRVIVAMSLVWLLLISLLLQFVCCAVIFVASLLLLFFSLCVCVIPIHSYRYYHANTIISHRINGTDEKKKQRTPSINCHYHRGIESHSNLI